MAQQEDWTSAKESFAAFCETVAALRHPVTGCPWDLEQTHTSLRKYMIEEAYEAIEVMEPADPQKLCDELGDVLLQVVLNAQIAKDQKNFSINDVVDGITKKMRRRHPHVFGEGGNDLTLASREKQDIRAKWDEIKAKEKNANASSKKDPGVFDEIRLNKLIPASMAAIEIGKVAKKIRFDWNDAKQVLSQLESEISELKQEIESGESAERLAEEMGDVIFSVAQLCRHLSLNPEVCGHDGNKKFLNRFKILEKIAKTRGIDVKSATQAQLEELWKDAKNFEKSR